MRTRPYAALVLALIATAFSAVCAPRLAPTTVPPME
jgi:hypothetical protein